MDHLEAIVEIKNVISPEVIDKVIPLINHRAKKKLKVNSGIEDTSIRNVKGHSLTFNTPTDIFYWNYIKKEIERIYILYKAKFIQMKSSKLNQIDLLKYSPGGKYEIHNDQATVAPRHLSVIINLNDSYKGGDLIFTDQNKQEIKRLKLGKGSVVFFPSNFLYPHGIEPITKGTRYSIVAWLQ
jgi:Rps23 Pro-64 3,4-dihydroxylase Tpa1-like proline 4-hydroxylase